MHEPTDTQWVGTWATTQDAMKVLALHNQTVRMISYVSIGGSTVRVRVSNSCGTGDLAVGAAQLGLHSQGANVVPASGRALTFHGSPTAVIPAGAFLVSDPVAFDVPPLSEVAVSLYLPGELPAGFCVTGHEGCHQTNYISSPGNFAAADELPVAQALEAHLFVSGIEVLAAPTAGGIVAFGDSLTEGNLSTLNANARWPDQLARRLVARPNGRVLGVMNQGIGGNRLLHDDRGRNGLSRFDSDALAQPGVTHVLIALGINDLRNSSQRQDQVVGAARLIAGLQQLIVRARTRGLKVIGTTLLPWEHETFSHLWTPEAEQQRQALNAWIRASGEYDAVVDFDALLRDPSHPTRLLPQWDCGDHLHPHDAGYEVMGNGIELSLFD